MLTMKYIFLFMLVGFFACKKQAEPTPSPAPTPTTTPPVVVLENTNGIPSVSRGMMDTMYAMVDYVDFSWPSMPISTSLEDQSEIKTYLSLISTTPQSSIPQNCKPLGRSFLNIKGNTYAEVDIYFSEGCKFYVFLKNNRPIYANVMTQEAIGFYNSILTRGGKAPIK
jgi:hypothetical protein